MKSNFSWAKGKSFGRYARSILKSSLITSFPEIALSTSWLKRTVKILVFISCVIGFVYQTVNFLHLYLAYPTVVNVHVSNPSQIVQPALTFCNRNRRRRSAVCESNINFCNRQEESVFCKQYPRSCPKGKGKKPIFTADPYITAKMETTFNWDRAKNEGHTDSIIMSCVKAIEGQNHRCEKPYRKVPTISFLGETNFCYTVDSLWGKPDVKEDVYANTFTFDLKLFAEPEEYLVYSEPILIQAAVHDRRKLVNPYFEGMALKGGMHYEAYVSMVSREMLPYPYDTMCTDYLKQWKKNNGTGPLNEMMCKEHCKLNKLKAMGVCIDRNVAYPHMEQLCGFREPHTTTSDIINNCSLECGNPCYDYNYVVRHEEVNSQQHLCSHTDEWCKYSTIKLSISFKKFQLTSYIYQPQFESVELYSYVGGYMGMWLGLSLISLFDLFETICYLLVYPIKRLKSKKRKIKPSPKAGTLYDNLPEEIYQKDWYH